tara:strand:- start:6 stop:242 length:237 start_codon:yes stop_codon:yes gene_type:complete
MNEYIIVNCPNCGDYIQIFKNEINCKIFRHGILKSSGKQINPHLKKSLCDKLLNEGKIYGCGKPFMLKHDIAVTCDYI